jgi:hypothetical protein
MMSRSDEIRRLKEARAEAYAKADQVIKSCPDGAGWNEAKEKEFDRFRARLKS